MVFSLSLPLSFSVSLFRSALLPAAKLDWLARADQQRKRAEADRDCLTEGKRERGRNERRICRDEGGGWRGGYQGFPHLHRQCLTSVTVARPPRDESITLNNVNVSPSQHKTNNHCSLPRPMGMASTRGSPVPHSPLASLVSTPLASSNTDPRLLFFSFCFSARASDLVYVASLKSRRSSSRTYALSRERR